MSCEPRLNAAIKHRLVAMPVEVLHSSNLIDMNSSCLIQRLQTKGVVDIELHSIVGTSGTSCLNSLHRLTTPTQWWLIPYLLLLVFLNIKILIIECKMTGEK